MGEIYQKAQKIWQKFSKFKILSKAKIRAKNISTIKKSERKNANFDEKFAKTKGKNRKRKREKFTPKGSK